MSGQKNFRRGEVIFREGDKPGTIYVVQSGLVSVYLAKNKKNIELYKATTGQLVGEEALFGLPIGANVQAVNDVMAFEVRVDAARQALDSSNAAVRLIVKSLVDKQKTVYAELKATKGEQDSTPCPPDNTAKVFACLYHLAKYYGEKKDTKIVINWTTLKRYAQRLFLESPIRLEHAFNILVKLKLAEVKMVKNDTDKDAPDEMGPCTFHDLAPVERFFEFYQNFHFKGSNPGILRYDEKCAQTAGALVKLSEGERMDKAGVVYMNYRDTTEKMKAILGATFTPEQIMRLETKGLFVKRESNNQGGTLAFIRSEFVGMIEAWKILREVEKWNEIGFVDLKEPEAPKAPAAIGASANAGGNASITCPTCLTLLAATARFCSGCGAKLGQAAA